MGRQYGDRAPHISKAWLRRIRQSGIGDMELLSFLDETTAYLSPGVRRPMPYLLTALEGMAMQWQRDRRPAQRQASASGTATPAGDREIEAPEEAGTPPTLWHRIRAEILPAVAPSWQQLLRRTIQHADDGTTLTLRAPDATDVQLLKRVVGRIEAEAIGCGAPRTVRIAMGHPRSEREGADRSGARPSAPLLAAG